MFSIYAYRSTYPLYYYIQDLPCFQILCVLKKCFTLIFLLKVADVFAFAQKSVISPSGPLYCRNSKTLTPRFVRALKRIFIHCDCDRDGALNAAELNDFQVLPFPSHMKHQSRSSFII